MEQNETYLGSPENPKTAAVVCYITIIGWLVSYFMLYKNRKSEFSLFHLKQALMLHILFFVFNIIGVIGFWFSRAIMFIGQVGSILLILLWLMGMYYAISERKKLMPLIGAIAESIFNGLA